MVRKYWRHYKPINTRLSFSPYPVRTERTNSGAPPPTIWDENDDTDENDNTVAAAAAEGLEITTIFREKEVVYLVQVFLHGK